MKIIIIVIVLIAIAWFIAIKIQEAQRIPIADKLINEKLKELESKKFDELVKLIGKGYTQENKVVKGVTYYMGYIISKPKIVSGIHTSDSAKVATAIDPGEIIDKIEISGYVDCITIIPFIYFKMGPSFHKIIERRNNS